MLAEAVADAPVRLGLTGEAVGNAAAGRAGPGATRPPTRERVLLAAHRGPGYVYWRQLAGVVVLSGPRPRAAYLRALVAPQASYLTERRWKRGGHVRRGWRTLTGPLRHRVVAAARRATRRAGAADATSIRARR